MTLPNGLQVLMLAVDGTGAWRRQAWRLAEQAERYDELAQHMRNVGSAGSSLSV